MGARNMCCAGLHASQLVGERWEQDGRMDGMEKASTAPNWVGPTRTELQKCRIGCSQARPLPSETSLARPSMPLFHFLLLSFHAQQHIQHQIIAPAASRPRVKSPRHLAMHIHADNRPDMSAAATLPAAVPVRSVTTHVHVPQSGTSLATAMQPPTTAM